MICGPARLLICVSDRLAALAKECHGATAVETAIVLPVFLLLLFTIVEAGLLFWTQSTLQFAVEAAARCAAINTSLCGTTSQIQSYAATQAYGMSISSASFTVSTPSCGYQVSISYPFTTFISDVYSGTLTLNASSCYWNGT